MVDTSYMIIISPKDKRQKIAELFKLVIQVWNFQDKHVESYSNEIFLYPDHERTFQDVSQVVNGLVW